MSIPDDQRPDQPGPGGTPPTEPLPGGDLPEEDDLRVDPELDPDLDYEDVDDVETDDPDLARARELQGTDPLVTDELRPEEELEEFEPPDVPSTPTDEQLTLDDELEGETIDERLSQEEPDDRL